MNKLTLLSFFAFSFLIISTDQSYSQTNPYSLIHAQDETGENSRAVYLHFTVSPFEYFGLGLGYQLSENYGVSFKMGVCLLSKGLIPNANGFGFKITRTLNNRILNSINGELIAFTGSSVINFNKKLLEGGAIEINIGYENKFERGIYFTWMLGVAANAIEGAPPLFLPNLKVGLNINF